ncbi:kinase-like protein [Cadophora sp. DSE1049]|nr:kinase-like protein [Cadophora sp. DSE1049]
MASHPSCSRAREALMDARAVPGGHYLPQGTTPYFKHSAVVRILREFPVQDIFLCDCSNCHLYADVQGGVDNRRAHFDEEELLGEYAAIYALLIVLRYPGLISVFRDNEAILGRSYMSDKQLGFLNQHNGLTSNQPAIVREEILEHQHQFQVRQFIARTVVTKINESEILPIHNETHVGEGDFGAVYAFDVPEEYLHDSLKVFKTKRFARKIFNQSHGRAPAAREWVNQLYVNKLQHSNLMLALAAFELPAQFFIILELAQSTLYKYLLSDGKSDGNAFTPRQLWNQVHGLASGLAYLHGTTVKGGKWTGGKIFHMDLKPSNVLIVNGIMKIADFGLSTHMPWPTSTESEDREGSKVGGNGWYAPPTGGASYAYDMYSLGAIISEIACFDVGKSMLVQKYRQSRLDDKIEGQQHGSRQFFYPDGHDMKKSVTSGHQWILDVVQASKSPLARRKLQEWQEEFFRQDLFDIIESMLHKSKQERPKAEVVAKQLGIFFKRADDVISRRCSAAEDRPHEVDIWGETLDGTVDTSPPDHPEHIFVAHLDGQKCGLWLYLDTPSGYLKIRQFVCTYDQDRKQERSKELEIYVDRKQSYLFKGVVPLYVHDIANASLSLVKSEVPQPITYKFRTISEALLFQGLLTGQHVHQGVSFGLESFSFRQKRRFKSTREISFSRPAFLQLWTDRILRDGEPQAPLMVTNCFIQNDPGLKEFILPPTVAVIRLAKLKTYSVDITNGIPLMLQEEPKYTEYREARLFLENENDKTTFWSILVELQTAWHENQPVFELEEPVPNHFFAPMNR